MQSSLYLDLTFLPFSFTQMEQAQRDKS